ncbi:bacteriohemerythrin [Candidatus Caldatribacterium sp. SIUC1]|uniref:bacteriohemerythrin n=1 Tax=Candidatus Caldatribacterium sp. SIUC1 TaxID=3418365 RepID=UPI003F692C05
MALVWSDTFSVGVVVIDEQHKELFARTNRLLEACQEGRGKDAVQETLAFLGDYVKTHFATEEKLMVQYRYPGFDAHKRLHEGFTETFLRLQKEAEKSVGVALVTQVNKTVVDWWVNHILKVDKELGAFLRAKMGT